MMPASTFVSIAKRNSRSTCEAVDPGVGNCCGQRRTAGIVRF